jgi:hypothetical protein
MNSNIISWSFTDGKFVNYTIGQLTSFNGKIYKCIMDHVCYSPTWTPDVFISAWSLQPKQTKPNQINIQLQISKSLQ